MKKRRQSNQKALMFLLLILALLIAAVCLMIWMQSVPDESGTLVDLPVGTTQPQPVQPQPTADPGLLTLDDIDIADFLSDQPFVELNGNEPEFTVSDMTTDPFETYAELDELGRCGVAYANICQELMPTEARGNISQVKPTGWQSVQYDNVDGKSLYNRCHLIGFQLAGENANKLNLITGTRYLNVTGMLPFENLVADYVKETDNHVLYRVTPVYRGDELVAIGVQMEGYSVEDEGDGVCFNVFCYNAQPGIGIDYATGNSWADPTVGLGEARPGEIVTYILNTNSKKFHLPDCSGVSNISEANRQTFTGTRAELTAQGYAPCGTCKP